MDQGIESVTGWRLGPTKVPEIGGLFDGRYQLVGILGKGAVGVVYRARDREQRGAFVALKLLHPAIVTDEVQLKRLESEVRLNRELDHPNIIRIDRFAKASNGMHYLTMECLEGGTLDELRQNGRLPFPEVLRILQSISEGMAHAHSKGIVHRDLKPANIFVSDRGKVTITDFGLARALEENLGLTKSNEAVGTPYYMAPEQFRGARPSFACDVYSIGVIAFELVTGARPFHADSFYGLAQAHLKEPLPSMAEQCPGTPCWFEKFVAQATAKKPEARFQTASELSKALRSHLKREYLTQTILGNIIKFFKPEGTLCTFLSSKGLPRHRTRYILAGVLGLWLLGHGIRAVPPVAHFCAARLISLEHSIDSQIATSILAPIKSYVGTNLVWSNERLLEAIAVGETRSVRLLLDAGMSPRTLTLSGMSALSHSAQHRQPLIAELLLDRGAKVNEKDAAGKTPLHYAVEHDAPAVVRVLLAHGALTEAQDPEGKTALEYAEMRGDRELVQLLSAQNSALRKP